MTAPHLQTGARAEAACCHYLLQQGLKLIDKNYRCRCGEIDLIMLDRQTLAFIEVRYRKNSTYGGAAASVTRVKQNRLRLTAEQYLQQNKQYKYARFDVVAMAPTAHSSNTSTNNGYTFNWIKNAF